MSFGIGRRAIARMETPTSHSEPPLLKSYLRSLRGQTADGSVRAAMADALSAESMARSVVSLDDMHWLRCSIEGARRSADVDPVSRDVHRKDAMT